MLIMKKQENTLQVLLQVSTTKFQKWALHMEEKHTSTRKHLQKLKLNFRNILEKSRFNVSSNTLFFTRGH